jgi:hypothetical protein
MSEKYINILKTEKSLEYRDFRNKKISNIISDIKKIFVDSNVTNSEINEVLHGIPAEL